MSLTTYLAAEPAPWSDIAGSYDLDFGHVLTRPDPLQRRDWTTGNFDITKSTDFGLDIGKPDESHTIWHDDTQVNVCLSILIG